MSNTPERGEIWQMGDGDLTVEIKKVSRSGSYVVTEDIEDGERAELDLMTFKHLYNRTDTEDDS